MSFVNRPAVRLLFEPLPVCVGEIELEIGLGEFEGVHLRGGGRRVWLLQIAAAVEHLRRRS